MRPPVNRCLSHTVIWPSPAEATEVEWVVMNWFVADHEVLWIPIYEIDEGAGSLAQAKLNAGHFADPRLLHSFLDCYDLPMGIKGWLFPAHLEDTDIVCTLAAPQDLSFGYLQQSATGQRISWRDNTEAGVG